MRIGILTSWNVPCGISQYSARYADALRAIGHEPVILAAVGDPAFSSPEETNHEVVNVGTLGRWCHHGETVLGTSPIEGMGLDAVHVQYQSSLFRQPDLVRLRNDYTGTMAITFHDNAVHHTFPFSAFDRLFTHRKGVGCLWAKVIPMPIEVRKPIVCTFGLGRTRSDLLREMCDRKGWVFDDWSSNGLPELWQPHDVLMDRLRSSDAIVIWYEDDPGAGSSSAARMALAARRPVFTNTTRWFEEMPPVLTGRYEKVPLLSSLERVLAELFCEPSYISERSWPVVAAATVDSLI